MSDKNEEDPTPEELAAARRRLIDRAGKRRPRGGGGAPHPHRALHASDRHEDAGPLDHKGEATPSFSELVEPHKEGHGYVTVGGVHSNGSHRDHQVHTPGAAGAALHASDRHTDFDELYFEHPERPGSWVSRGHLPAKDDHHPG